MPKLVRPKNLPEGVTPSALETIRNLVVSGRQVFGAPGASLSWGIDGTEDGDVNAGAEGERMTARIIREWISKYPYAMIVHSVRWPGSDADSDHVLVIGNNVIIIDSKRWKSKRKYSVTASGTIKRGTVDFPEGKVKMIPALNAWRNILPPQVKVSGIVCIAQDEVFVPYDNHWYKAPYKLVTAENLTQFLDEKIAKSSPGTMDHVNLGILSIVISRAIKPRDRRSEFINVQGIRNRQKITEFS